MRRKIALTVAAVLTAVAVWAAPAPWYKWRSKLDGGVYCSQTRPGDGWERISGPYQDARCKIPGKPGE